MTTILIKPATVFCVFNRSGFIGVLDANDSINTKLKKVASVGNNEIKEVRGYDVLIGPTGNAGWNWCMDIESARETAVRFARQPRFEGNAIIREC